VPLRCGVDLAPGFACAQAAVLTELTEIRGRGPSRRDLVARPAELREIPPSLPVAIFRAPGAPPHLEAQLTLAVPRMGRRSSESAWSAHRIRDPHPPAHSVGGRAGREDRDAPQRLRRG